MNNKIVWGFEEALQACFHKPFKSLNENEYLSIVVRLIGLNGFNPVSNPGNHGKVFYALKNCCPGSTIRPV